MAHPPLPQDPVLDTKALLAWNSHMAVLSFRGTVSMRNALTDITACPSPVQQLPRAAAAACSDVAAARQPAAALLHAKAAR